MKNKWWIIGCLLLTPFVTLSQPAERACFSVSGGFYETSPVVEIFPFYQNHHIRFTTNGNRPTAQSQLYTEPLLLDEGLYSHSDIYTIFNCPETDFFLPDSVQHCIVIRAAVFDENDNRVSEVATNSYFIQSLGCDTHNLPVVSICADSLDLFDYNRGIFVPGAWFDPLNPDWTGNYYQSGPEWERPMNIEFYELDNSGINQQAGIRTHGGNGRRFQQKSLKCYAREEYGENRFKHGFFESIPQNNFKHLVLKPFMASWNQTGVNDHISNQIASQLNMEALASRPVILYLNGEYWGIYYIHERPDERYLEDHFGVDPEQVNLLSGWGNVVSGTSVHFDSLFLWLATADLSEQSDYDAFASKIDLDNFIDYQILELFLENLDWPGNNVRCWLSDNGKWRWIFFDGDACVRWLTFYAFEYAVYDGDAYWPSSRKATLFFRKLLCNEQFKQRFYDRFCALLNTVFSFDNTSPIFDDVKQRIEPEIPAQAARFGFPADVQTWTTNMGHSQWFLKKRCEVILPVLEEFLRLSVAEVTLTPLSVYPNPSTGPITLQFSAEKHENASCCIYDITGRLVFVQTVPTEKGLNFAVLDPSLPSGIYVLRINDYVTKIVCQ